MANIFDWTLKKIPQQHLRIKHQKPQENTVH
jgi:hypothetical protein